MALRAKIISLKIINCGVTYNFNLFILKTNHGTREAVKEIQKKKYEFSGFNPGIRFSSHKESKKKILWPRF